MNFVSELPDAVPLSSRSFQIARRLLECSILNRSKCFSVLDAIGPLGFMADAGDRAVVHVPVPRKVACFLNFFVCLQFQSAQFLDKFVDVYLQPTTQACVKWTIR